MKLLWDDEQGRIGVIWRLLLHGVLLLVAVSVFTVVLSLPLGFLDPPDAEILLTEEEAVVPTGLLLAGTLGALAGALLATWLAAIYLDRRPFHDLGIRLNGDWWSDFSFGLLLGLLLVGGSFAIKLQMGWVEVTGFGVAEVGAARFIGEFIALAAACLAVGIYEELVVRGYQMTNLAEALNIPWWREAGGIVGALLLTSAAFALLHALNPGPSSSLGLLNIALISVLVLGLAYALTGSLAISIGLHTSWNLALSFIFGLPVSGVVIGHTSVLLTEDIGPELWTGGGFGQEGGLLGTVAIVVGLLALLAWVRLRRGRITLHTDIARPPQRGTPGKTSDPSPGPEQAGGEREQHR